MTLAADPATDLDTARRARRRSRLPLAAAVVAVVAWSTGPLFVRGIDATFQTIVFWRLLVAIPVMWAVALASGGRPSLGLFRRCLVPGALFGASFALGFASFQKTSIANATLIPALLPAVVLVVAPRLLGEQRVSARDLGFALTAFAGVVAVVLGAGTTGGASITGDLLAFGNLVLFAAYFLTVKHLRTDGVHAGALVATVMTVAWVVIAPWAAATGGDLGGFDRSDWVLLVGMVAVPGIFGHVLMTWSQGAVSATTGSLLLLGQPPLSAAGAWLFFDQGLRPVQLAGALVVLVAVGGIVAGQRGAMTKQRSSSRPNEYST